MTGRLYIDLGNSRIKWMPENLQGCSDMRAMKYNCGHLSEVLDSAWRFADRPEQLWLASVAGSETDNELTAWVRDAWELTPHVMKVSAADCGLTCGYLQPEQLGVDRWAAMISAYRYSPDGVCVVDCGTAVTLDMVDASGRHLGGYILPGVQAMKHKLLQETAIDMEEQYIRTGQEWGNSTVTCVELGTRKAVVALIEQSIERLQAAGICDPGLILTGGEAGLIEPLMQIDCQRRDRLVLEGIRLYAREHGS
ncbi:type III pantothenate kinase [Thiolapillus sp.]|uniref:type III pantothenate kinase n=1 Tax=Thiolapillus sp. TaxID=2017437 RepID=UPI0025F1AD5A|nr:type III pantothenate kinase [Thiolapillus sp.]